MEQGTGGGAAPITLLITRKVAPDHHAAFQTWMRKGLLLAAGFPGFLGAGVLAPSTAGCSFLIMLRLSDADAMARWERSLSRRMWLEHGEVLIQESQSRRMTGMELIFGKEETSPVPPRWKRAVSVWLFLYPVALCINMGILILFPSAPVFARVMMTSLVQVPLMIYAVVPLVNRVFSRWLYAAGPGAK